jgi:hypothetical protein
MRSIVFRVLFQQTKKETNKQTYNFAQLYGILETQELGILETQELRDFKSAIKPIKPRMHIFTHKTTYAYLSLFMGCWSIQEHLESDVNWAGDV